MLFRALNVTLDLKCEIYLLNLWFSCIFHTNNSQFNKWFKIVIYTGASKHIYFCDSRFISFLFSLTFHTEMPCNEIKTITRYRKLVEISIQLDVTLERCCRVTPNWQQQKINLSRFFWFWILMFRFRRNEHLSSAGINSLVSVFYGFWCFLIVYSPIRHQLNFCT